MRRSTQRKAPSAPFDISLRPEHSIAPNLLERRFDAVAGNRRWAADCTYLWTTEGRPNVALVIDLFSRRVVGLSMGSQVTAQLVSDALLMAIWRRGPVSALLHHSDQCSPYPSEQFQRLLKERGVICSMSRSGDCRRNAAVESFFHTLKVELVRHRRYLTRDEARQNIFEWIDVFYNATRSHST